jgi:hypothetical protein
MWIYMNLYESKHLNTHELTCLLTWFYLILCQIVWFIPNLYEFIQLCFEFIWKYAHCQTATHCRTAGQPHTAAHTAAHCHTAACSRALCRKLPHTARIRMPHTAHSILHTAHSCTSQLTWIQTNVCERIWICLNIHMIFKLSDLFRIYTNLYEYVLNLFENVLTAGLPHTAAQLGSRTLPRALPDSRTLPRTLPCTLLHCRTQLCALPHTAAHCVHSNAGQPHTAHCTLHTAHSRTPRLTWFKPVLFECVCIYMNLRNFMRINMNSYKL